MTFNGLIRLNMDGNGGILEQLCQEEKKIILHLKMKQKLLHLRNAFGDEGNVILKELVHKNKQNKFLSS